MADLGIFTKNVDIQARAGANASATLKLTAETDKYVLDVEAYINLMTRYNWSDWYVGTPNLDVALILKDVGACLCAIRVINADMSGFTTLSEAQVMVNILWALAQDGIRLLREKPKQNFILNA